MELISIVYILIGLILGYLIAHFKSKSSQALSKEEAEALEQEREQAMQTISRLEERNQNQSDQLESAKAELKQADTKANEAEKENVRLKSINDNLSEKLSEQKKEMEALQEKFKDEFENLANKILEEKSQKFTKQNKEKLDQLLKPLGEKMEAFKKKVEETYEKEMREKTSLKEQIKQMAELNKDLTDEAKNLTKALKNDSKTQGRWGEVILQRILEKSGLTEGREYDTQVGVKTSAGGQQYLDVVVQLPDEKKIIIDSKVSLKAYDRFIEADEEREQERALNEHISSMRAHVKNLGNKNYQEQFANLSPDFVLMFVPIESAFGLALQHDSDLYYEAFEKNIVIVSPSTLLATLATIDSVWKQEYQSKNAQKIAERGGKLYDKFVLFVESLEEIGMRIRQSQESYDQAMNRLKMGRGDLIGQADKLRKLGVNNTKKLSGDLTDEQQLSNGTDGEEESEHEFSD